MRTQLTLVVVLQNTSAFAEQSTEPDAASSLTLTISSLFIQERKKAGEDIRRKQDWPHHE